MKKAIPKKSDDVLVTKKMLFGVRNELIEKISSVKTELKSDIHAVKSAIQELKSEIHGVKADINGVKSEVHSLRGEIHRIGVLVEEQNARNKPVLDSILSIMERQERMELEQQEIRKILLAAR